ALPVRTEAIATGTKIAFYTANLLERAPCLLFTIAGKFFIYSSLSDLGRAGNGTRKLWGLP
ncbi:MAG: hypothetical protein RLN82_03170, partial [Pseudomonadales bacterium]